MSSAGWGGRGRKKRPPGCAAAAAAADRDPGDQASLLRRSLQRGAAPLLQLLRLLVVQLGAVLLWLYGRLLVLLPAGRAAAAAAAVGGQVSSDLPADGSSSSRQVQDSDRVWNHHKQAFEYISVALRIDEEEKGGEWFMSYWVLCCGVFKIGLNCV